MSTFWKRTKNKKIVQLIVDCEVILDPKQMKVFEMW